MSLIKPDGVVGLLTPSGIASDKSGARFFKGVATEGRLRALYDFENRRTRHNTPPFFPDVDSRFKFCAFVAGLTPMPNPAQCAFFLQDVSELDDSERCFTLKAKDFARVNPNTGTTPIFRTKRDAELTTAIYNRLSVLVNRSSAKTIHKVWPFKYSQMLNMTSDSHLFRTRRELEESEGAWPIGGNRYRSEAGDWVPLYEGKMVQAFDHRAASVKVNPKNLNRPGQPVSSSLEQRSDPGFSPNPRYFVQVKHIKWMSDFDWSICFKDLTSPTNMRTMIAAMLPLSAANHKLPCFFIEGKMGLKADLLLGNLNSIVFDYCARQKVNTNSFTLFLLEQLPVVPPETYETTRLGHKTAGEIVREAVLELIYTAYDMTPFARDMGYVDEEGEVLPPFVWDEERRLHLRARLDAVFFHLYGVTDHDDVQYIYSTFPIVEREETNTYGNYRSRELCLAYMNTLNAGKPDEEVNL